MLHNAVIDFIWKKWAQEVALLYCVALWWHKQEQQDRKVKETGASIFQRDVK